MKIKNENEIKSPFISFELENCDCLDAFDRLGYCKTAIEFVLAEAEVVVELEVLRGRVVTSECDCEYT